MQFVASTKKRLYVMAGLVKKTVGISPSLFVFGNFSEGMGGTKGGLFLVRSFF